MAYVPFRDGAFPFDSSAFDFIAPIVGRPPLGSQVYDRIDLSLDGGVLYGDATGPTGPLVYADAIGQGSSSALGTQFLQLSQLNLGVVQIAPLAGGAVAVVISALSGGGGATSFAIFSRDLGTTVQPFLPTTSSIASPVENPSVPGGFLAIDSTQSVVAFSPPSYQQSASTSGSGIVFAGPIVCDGTTVFATSFDQGSGTTSVYAIDAVSLAPRLVGVADGALQLRAAAAGRILLYSPSGNASLALLSSGAAQAVPIPLPPGLSALNNLVSQTLAADGSRILLGYVASGVSTIYVLDALTGRQLAAVPAPTALADGRIIVGQIRTR